MRKLLSVTCIASLLLSLLSPAFAQPISPYATQPTSWGMLKSRYGRPDVTQSGMIRKAVADAILSNPYLTDADLGYVGKVGPDAGYLGIGSRGGTDGFIVFVSGNFVAVKGFDFDFSQSGKVEVRDLLQGVGVVWKGTIEDFQDLVSEQIQNQTPTRTLLRPSGAGDDNSALCWSVAGGAAYAASREAQKWTFPGSTLAGAIFVGATLLFTYSACMHESNPKIYGEDEHPIGAQHDLRKPGPGNR